MVSLKNKIRGMFLGVAIGDSLGMPFESKPYYRVKDCPRVKDYINGRHKKGTYTDDTQLTLAVAQAIIDTDKIDMNAIAQQHCLAYQDTVSGWGSTTREAVKKIIDGEDWATAGNFNGQENRGLGNGIPMKIAPLAAYYALTKNVKNFTETLFDFTAMTHQTSIAISSALAHTTALLECLQTSKKTFNPKKLVKKVCRASEVGRSFFPETLKDDITDRIKELLPIYDIPGLLQDDEYLVNKFGGGTCYVYNSLPFSYAFFLRKPFNADVLFEVAYAGGDADTNASIVGGMLGALNGTRVFPKHLVNGLKQKDEIIQVADSLLATLQS